MSLEGYLYDDMAVFFDFECLEDGAVLEVGYIGEFLVIEDNTNYRRWFVGYELYNHT